MNRWNTAASSHGWISDRKHFSEIFRLWVPTEPELQWPQSVGSVKCISSVMSAVHLQVRLYLTVSVQDPCVCVCVCVCVSQWVIHSLRGRTELLRSYLYSHCLSVTRLTCPAASAAVTMATLTPAVRTRGSSCPAYSHDNTGESSKITW